MGRGRAKTAVAGTVAALALAAAGCGAQSHPNEPRPQVPTRVSITLGSRGLVVQPPRIAFGPEPKQQIPQNQNHSQPPIKTKKPLDVIFVIANQTRQDSLLRIEGVPKEVESEPLLASSPTTFQTELPTGKYTLRAEGIPSRGGSTLAVGPYRASSENDVLLP
jgi:hypothetical protein